MRASGGMVAAAAVAALTVPPGLAQGWKAGVGPAPAEEVRYVNLAEILAGFDVFHGRTVRTSGRLDLHPNGRFRLRDDDNNALDIVPVAGLDRKFNVQARTLLGRNCEVTGRLIQGSTFEGSPARAETLLTLYFDAYTIGAIANKGQSPPPSPPPVVASAPPTPGPPPPPKAPPVVVFAMPLEGDADVPADARFTVQFSKDMDRGSFEGRVVLRYAGPAQPGDPSLAVARVTYDEGRRALTVEPARPLRSGRAIELALLPGIIDGDGLALIARQGAKGDEAVEVLTYRVRADTQGPSSGGDRRHARSAVAPPHPRPQE